MHDDTRWWDDDDDDESVAALQRVLAPLREPPRPWGDLVAQMRFAVPQPRASSGMRRAVVVAGLAAALLVVWIWGRSREPESVVLEPGLDVAAPRVEPAPPIVVRVPVPMPIEPSSLLESTELVRELQKLEMEADREAAKKRSRRVAAAPQELPQTLSREDWFAGLATIGPAAKACGVAHGMAADDRVTVELRVEGATGRVTDSTGFTREANGPLADCVATAAMKARFRRFRDATAYAMLPVPMGAAKEDPKTAAAEDELPEVLNTKDIEKGLAPVKAAAKACGSEHGAPSGQIVKIKLTIEGATGRVTMAVAESPHAETALGDCVTDALAEAGFPRFRKPWLGVVYPVRM